MLVITTEIPGVRILELPWFPDSRGSIRTLVHGNLVGSGISESFEQFNIVHNVLGATRGMHWQPGQSKLCTVVSGSAVDVILDVRRGSPTFGRTVTVGLSGINRTAVYIPDGCAHGFQATYHDTNVLYFMSTPWKADEQRCVAIEDPYIDFSWPIPLKDAVIAEKDRGNNNLGSVLMTNPDYLPQYVNGSR